MVNLFGLFIKLLYICALLTYLTYKNMSEKELTPEESFNIINKAITNFKVNYKESAQIFLLWGWLLTLASLSNFIILRILHSREAYELMGPLSLANWGFFILTGFIILFFLLRRMNRNKKVYSYLENYINKLWQVAGASFIIGTLVCIKLEIMPPPIMLLIAGIATTTTGWLLKFRPLIIGGIVFFAFSVATTFVTNEYISLLTAAAILCGYVIPGYLLKSAKA